MVRGLPSLVLVPLAGCSLILDFDDPPAPPDAIAIDAIPNDACTFGEPNETRQAAFPLTPVTGQLAAICEDGDRDFYSFSVLAGQAVTIEILFGQVGTAGDLELRLYDETGMPEAMSLSIDADERIVCPGSMPTCGQLAEGNYFFEVYGYEDAQVNAYTLNFAVTGP